MPTSSRDSNAKTNPLTQAGIQSFLLFGYFLDYNSSRYQAPIGPVSKDRLAGESEDALVATGAELFKLAVARQFERERTHAVPLSGGLDSRAILGALLEHTEATNIIGYSYGVPGSLDFEIGSQLGRRLGIRHSPIPLTDHEFSLPGLLDAAREKDGQTVMFYHPPMNVLRDVVGDADVWSGAVIDVYFGRHNHVAKAADLAGARRNFIAENLFVRSALLTDVDEGALFRHIATSDHDDNSLVLEHKLDLLNRQIKYVAPHVLLLGFRNKVLFSDLDLVQFALDLDNRFLDNQDFYKRMLSHAFPALFRLGIKENWGLPISAPRWRVGLRRSYFAVQRTAIHALGWRNGSLTNPMLNYLDFDDALRTRSDLSRVVRDAIQDLAARDLGLRVCPIELWRRHRDRQGNFADALLTLASLEINIKVRDGA